jgi:plastocyanin
MIVHSVPTNGEGKPPSKPRPVGRWKIAVVIIAIVGIAVFSEVVSYYYPDEAPSAPYLVTVYMPNGAADNRSATFSPATVTLVLGVNNTVEWYNLDHTAHTVVFTQVPADSNVTTASFSSSTSPGIIYDTYYGPILLPAPGTYKYYDSLYQWMTGTLIVKS